MKILVCDDDVSTIDVLEKQINYEKLGIDTFLRAYNGLTAKEIINKEKPEIVLCDIGMPKENGLEVLKYVYENKIDLEFAFLTCYEDFEYAKKALQYGADDYINKPFEIDEIVIAIQKMMANYYRKHTKGKSEKEELILSIYKQISDGSFTDKQEIAKILSDNDIDIDVDSYWRIVFTYSDMTNAIKKTWNTDLLYGTCQEIISSVLTKNDYLAQCNSYVGTKYLWNICLLPNEIDEEELFNKCNQLKEYFEDYMSLQPAILIMDSFKFYELSSKVTLAYKIIRKIKSNVGRVYSQKEAEEYVESESSLINDNRVLWFIKNKDKNAYHIYIHQLVEETEDDLNELKQIQKELINVFLTALKDNDLSSKLLFENETIISISNNATDSSTSFEKYADSLMNVFEELISQVIDSNDVIARAKKYIDEHYHENIDREDVAAAAFVTPNYLSKQFRIKMNINMREYINRLRIQEAQRLLLTTTMTVSEIAIFVGYDNISYFSTVFRKLTSKSPIDWREQ